MPHRNTTSIFLCTGVVAFAHYTYSNLHATERNFDQMTFYPCDLLRGLGRKCVPPSLTSAVDYFTFRGGRDDLQGRVCALVTPWLLPLFDDRPDFTVMVYDSVHGVLGWQATRFGDTLALVPIRPQQVYGYPNQKLIPEEALAPRKQQGPQPKPHWLSRLLPRRLAA